MADAGKIELLFSHEEGDPFLSGSPDPGSAAAEVERVEQREETHLADITASANELDKQRWAVVIADNPEGERLRELVHRLVDKRAEDQQAEVMTVRVPPNMGPQAAMRWRKDIFPQRYRNRESRRPRYLCILGDMDGVSMATQQVLALDGFPGRLVCRDQDGYQAYVDKVLGWENEPSVHERPRSLFYTVHDGTSATRSGYDKLVQPCFEHCQEIWGTDRRDFPAARIENRGSKDELDPDEFLDLADDSEPTVLFSLSHGMGPPRRRPWTAEQARDRQGSMVFGTEGAITPADIGETTFLPGGLWFYFACFGAGTPSESAYYHWMNMLAESGMEGLGNLQAVLKGLDRQGGFTSGLAQAALANPNGPLGMLGHVDLAWSYGYEELQIDDNRVKGTNRASNYFDLLTKLVKGERLGVSMLNLQRSMAAVSTEINDRYDACKERGVAPEGAGELERMALGNLWMQRQDLRGYVILGDPAVRLPLSSRQKDARGSGRSRSRSGMGRRGARSPAPRGHAIERAERAIMHFLLDQISMAELQEKLGVSDSDARARADAYRDAGRSALAKLMND